MNIQSNFGIITAKIQTNKLTKNLRGRGSENAL